MRNHLGNVKFDTFDYVNNRTLGILTGQRKKGKHFYNTKDMLLGSIKFLNY